MKMEEWVAGSQVFRLMKNVRESLAGRVGIVSLTGLSDTDIDWETYYCFYVDTYLQRDIRDLYGGGSSTTGFVKLDCAIMGNLIFVVPGGLYFVKTKERSTE